MNNFIDNYWDFGSYIIADTNCYFQIEEYLFLINK